MTHPSDELIRYRLERAVNTLQDARLLAAADRWDSCINRLYYACFYAVSALLLRHNLSSSKHAGARALFNRHFVRTGKVPQEMGETYNLLFERRQEGDYDDLVRFDQSKVRPWIPKVEAFVEHVSAIIEGGQG